MTTLSVASKILRALITVFLLVSFVFVVLRLSGDPAIQMLGVDADPRALDAFRERWGLDRPIWDQYVSYLWNIFQGDFGHSFIGNRPATEVVAERLPKTLWLMGLTTIFTFGIGIPAGVYAALHRNTAVDRLTMGLTVASFSLPNFVVGIVLIMLFGVVLRVLPTAGSETWLHYILPVATMATADAAIFARFSRSAMLEVLSAPFMRTARAKGLLWTEAVRRHALPNASIPIVTVGGIYVGRQIAAATITENVFAWPGIGKLLVASVQNRDLAVVQCIVILVGVTMVVTNLLVDLAYGWLDPRTRSGESK
ncbi:ABC transporter permease [Rhodospira trueperi]|uniref:Peptide/nickel transport system permease protein n=1 Tax=Rhodospira trueperi TaxID=69960 RepID=A0A1G7AM74_9PROT|nr:ABC transporter permease [Rhodospira trueperi]SDE15901.1 peptide/nickel transport system permease protein [Rhodospira trueperi]